MPMKRAWWSWAPWRLHPGEQQGCACVQVPGRAEDKELVCGSTEEVPNCCFATAVEEKRNKEGVELSGTIWSLAFKSAAQLTPHLAAQLAGVKRNLRIFRGGNARAHDGMWLLIIFPLCSPSRLIPLCKYILHVLLAITEARLRICGVAKGLFPGSSAASLVLVIIKHYQ